MAGLKKMENPKKTMIYLDESMHQAVKYRAMTAGMSMSDLIRQIIAEHLPKPPVHRKPVQCKSLRRKAVRR